MRWIHKSKKFLLGSGLLVALFACSLIFSASANAAFTGNTGDIKGGKYFFEIKLGDKTEKFPIDSKTTKVTLNPAASGSSVSISGQVVTVSNVPPGTYGVTLNFSAEKGYCADAPWKTAFFAALSPTATAAFCALKDGTFIKASKVFPAVTVTAGQTSFLLGDSNLGNQESLGAARETDEFGQTVLKCTGSFIVNYVICPLVEATFGAMDFAMNNMIRPLLIVNPLSTVDSTGKQSPIYEIWSNIRNLANVVFILGFFVIIFSQATSIGISNYGIKKLLPKLIIVGIGINLSFFVCSFLVDVFNVLGAGAASLITSAVTDGQPQLDLTGSLLLDFTLVSGLLVAIAALPILIPAIMIFIIIGAFILFIAAVCILIRQILILFLILVSPIAFCAWLLPGTERHFRKWLTMFIQLLAMYPFIMLLFGAGKVVGTVLSKIPPVAGSGPVSAGSAEVFIAVLSFMGFVLPLIAIPLSIKWSSSTIHGMYKGMTNAGKGLSKAAGRKAMKSDMAGYMKERGKRLGTQENMGTYEGKNPIRLARQRAKQKLFSNRAFNAATGGYGGYARDSAMSARDEMGQRLSGVAGTNPPLARAILDIAGGTNADQAIANRKLDEKSARFVRQQVTQGMIGKNAFTAEIGTSALAKSGKLTNSDISAAEAAVYQSTSNPQERDAALANISNGIVSAAGAKGSMQHQNWGVVGGHLKQNALEPDLEILPSIQKEMRKKTFQDLHYSTFMYDTKGREAFDDLIGSRAPENASYREGAVAALKDNRVPENIKKEIVAAFAVTGYDPATKDFTNAPDLSARDRLGVGYEKPPPTP